GPLPVLTEPYGDMEEDEAEEIFAEIVEAGTAAGADCIFLETFLQLEMLLAAVRAAKRTALPVFCSMSVDARGRTLFGVGVEEMLEELEPMDVTAVGMNCSLGPDLALPVIREFAEKTALPLFFKPNAGMPVTAADGSVSYTVTAEEFAGQAAIALQTGRIEYLGGCCGTDPGFIRCLKAAAESL
ncbi:MAG: homocysteine S-methyltransferase family protein, partial [Lachnospiraceae bacterium]|nr:homocysteine S-methyltransferase family protein [Lachnospiraceae bacterium]